MPRIAVCDDEEKQLEKTARLLRAYLRPAPDGQGTVFESGRALLEQAESQRGFDLYLLDILMPGLDGIQTGRRLRALGDGGEILYLTSFNDFAADSYDVGAFFYLLKPVEERKLFRVLDAAADKLDQRRSGGTVVTTPDGPRRVLLDRILYVELADRCMRYHCTDGMIDSRTIRVPFREMAVPLLADRRFCPCGASFVLNLRHAAGVNGQTALPDNGRSVALPRTAAAAFKNTWGKYWLKEGTAW